VPTISHSYWIFILEGKKESITPIEISSLMCPVFQDKVLFKRKIPAMAPRHERSIFLAV